MAIVFGDNVGLVLGSVSLVAASAGGFAAYNCLRPRFPVKVNCWFCNYSTKVPYGNKNCWDCPQCEQYNGFAQDGDYNKSIPAQWIENLNHPVSELGERAVQAFNSGSDQLCEACNRNQLLKVKQLANFVPYSEANFDQEVEAYSAHLDQVYHLCYGCQVRVDRHLAEQDQRLSAKIEQVLQDKNTSLNESNRNDSHTHHRGRVHTRLPTPCYVFLLRLASLLCVMCVACAAALHILATDNSDLDLGGPLIAKAVDVVSAHSGQLLMSGTCTALLAVFLSGKASISGCDALCLLGWLVTLFIYTPTHYLSDLDLDLVKALVTSLVTVLSAWVVLTPRYSPTPVARITKKRKRRYLNDSTQSEIDLDQSTSDTYRTAAQPQTPGGKGNAQASDDPLEHFETMSIGKTNVRKRSPDCGVFSVNYPFFTPCASAPATPHSVRNLNSKKPILSPARFLPSRNNTDDGQRQPFKKATLSNPFSDKGPARQSLFSKASTYQQQSLSEPSPVEADRASLFSVHRHSQAGDTDTESVPDSRASQHSSQSSRATQGHAKPGSKHQQAAVNRGRRKSVLFRILLGISIGVNIFLVLHFLLDVQSVWNLFFCTQPS